MPSVVPDAETGCRSIVQLPMTMVSCVRSHNGIVRVRALLKPFVSSFLFQVGNAGPEQQSKIRALRPIPVRQHHSVIPYYNRKRKLRPPVPSFQGGRLSVVISHQGGLSWTGSVKTRRQERQSTLLLVIIVGGVVRSLLILVALLVGGSLGLVGGALLVVEGLPAFTEDLANLACSLCQLAVPGGRNLGGELTERDTRVLLTDVLALLVGEEHVGRKTTLGRVGVWIQVSQAFLRPELLARAASALLEACKQACNRPRGKCCLTLLAALLLDLTGLAALGGLLRHLHTC